MRAPAEVVGSPVAEIAFGAGNVDGAPEEWITSVLRTLIPRTSVGLPTGISVTLHPKRYSLLVELG